jgi:hypothetical protein
MERKDKETTIEATPEEALALLSFKYISGKDFEGLGMILADDATFIDPHFGPAIVGKEQIIDALDEGFKDVKSIAFEITSFGVQKMINPMVNSLEKTIGVFTVTTTEFNLAGETGKTLAGQAFKFKVTNSDGKLKLTHIEAYPQDLPLNES